MREKFLWVGGVALVLIAVGFMQTTTSTLLSRITGHPMSRTIAVNSSVLEGNRPLPRWVEIRMAPDENLIGIRFLGPRNGWAFSDKSIYKSIDGGKSWKYVGLERPSGTNLTSMAFVSASTGWLALRRLADNQTSKTEPSTVWLMHTSDGGQSWQTQYQTDAIVINTVQFLNAEEGWAVGRGFVTNDPYLSKLMVLHTNNGGQDWIDVSSKVNQNLAVTESAVQDFATDVYAMETAKAIVLTVSGRVLKTVDGGQSWREAAYIKESPQTHIGRLGFKTNKRMWVLGGTDSREGMWGILAQYDEGEWEVFRANLHLKDAFYLSDSKVLACGSALPISREKPWDEKRDGVIVYSVDNGRNWTVIYRNAEVQSINALTLVDSDGIWAVGSNGLLVHLDSRPETTSPSSN